MNHTQPITLTSLYNTLIPNTSESKTTYNIDPLPCAVAMHRKGDISGFVIQKDVTIPEDFDKADQIRNYYKKKYFWNNFKSSIDQSDYRRKVEKLLTMTDSWELDYSDIGLFVKLPVFYQEDKFYDQLKSTLLIDKQHYKIKTSVIKQLTYLGKTFRWQRTRRESFWFKDCHNLLYAYTTMHRHPFSVFFEEQIQTPRTFEFSSGVDRIENMWYNTIQSFSILKEQNA